MARIRLAVSMPEPLGTPENSCSHTEPTGAQVISGSSTYLANRGANTNSPHMP